MKNSDILEKTNTCVIIPTYNNEKTLENVILEVLNIIGSKNIIVVNDGSTDSTHLILNAYKKSIKIINVENNTGKGNALRLGFGHAISNGFRNAITIDSDGQHFPSDIPTLMNILDGNKGSVIMGSRNMNKKGVPNRSSFGNKFSNFWFWIITSYKLPDTQTGFRIYPLEPISKMKFYTNRFEFEIEIIVRLAWRGVGFKAIPIKVHYDQVDRVSHFRPFKDFTRISILNTVFVIICLIYFYPKRLFSKKTFERIKNEALKKNESNLRKATSLGFGVFMGIFPIWSFQILVGLPIASFFKLNRVLFVLAVNISIPPMIPFILYGSITLGQFLMTGEIDNSEIWNTSFESIKSNFIQYVVGAIVLSALSFVVVFAISLLILNSLRKFFK